MIYFFDEYTENTVRLKGTMSRLGKEAQIVVFQDDGSLPDGISTPYGYYVFQKNRKVYGTGEQKNIRCVEWHTESGWIGRADFYNRYGFRYISEFRDETGSVQSRVFYSDSNQEVVVEQPGNDAVTLAENGMVKFFFPSRLEFIRHYIKEAYSGEECVLFVETEDQFGYFNLESDDEDIWDQVLFSDCMLMNRYTDMGGKNEVRFYAIPEAYPENEAKGEALILTASDQIEQIENIIDELQEVIFHIAAHTQVSDVLYRLAENENVKVYPGISEEDLHVLWEKCDFYLDINHYWEVDDAVNTAHLNNLLIMGFDNTVHHKELLVGGCVYAPQDYRKMCRVIKYLREDTGFMKKVLLAQQEKRIEICKGGGFL